jgi:hypothetical protein
VYFGQLAGMAEGLSLGLAHAGRLLSKFQQIFKNLISTIVIAILSFLGYGVYKLVPTGSIDEVRCFFTFFLQMSTIVRRFLFPLRAAETGTSGNIFLDFLM